MSDEPKPAAEDPTAREQIEPGLADEPGQVDLPGPAAISALLERHNLPALHSIEPIDGGEVNGMLLVNGEMVLRINRRDPQLPKLAKEALVYRRLRRSTDVPGPEVLALDTARDIVPFDVLILSHVEGLDGNAAWANFDVETRERLSEEIGRFFGSIHGLAWAAYGDFNVAHGNIGQYSRWSDMLLLRLQRAAEQALETGALPQPLVYAVITELNDADSVLDTASAPALVHGDLHLGNLLFAERDGGWHVAAILDWEWCWTADAAWEIAALTAQRADEAPVVDAFIYGYRERHPVAIDLRSRIHLYRLAQHLEGAVIAHTHFADEPQRRAEHEARLQRLMRRG